jgi:Flp pilus assembly protein TadD
MDADPFDYYSEYLELIEKAHTLPPVLLLEFKIADNLCKIGQKLIEENKIDLAMTALKEAVQINPNDPIILNVVASFYIQLEENKKAEKLLRKVIQIEPDNLQSMNALAIVLFKNNQTVEAEKLLRSSLKIDPNDEFVRKALIMILLKTDRNEEAVELLGKQ